jgi:L-fuconolactonase
MRVLDSHLHVWDPAVLRYEWLDGPLRRRFAADELAQAIAAGPDADDRAFVFMQADAAPADSLAEVDWVTGFSDRISVRGIVARASLERGDAVQDELDALRERPLVVGIRRLLQDEHPGFAATPAFLAGARRVAHEGLTFDACLRWPQLPELIALADAVPGLPIVLDHLGKPPIGTPDAPGDPAATAWPAQVQALAERPGTWCKLSGLPAESPAGWTAEQVTPFLDVALDAFGPDRLLFGGDWPVSTPYGRWLATVTEWLEDRVGASADAVLWSNAERAYRLD